MSDATTIELRETRLEVQLNDEAEGRLGLDEIEIGENDDNRWLTVLGTFVQDKKVHMVVAAPWVADEKQDEPSGSDDWFLPFTITEKDIYATRFKASKYKPD